MNPHELFLEATRRGLRLEPAGDKLSVYPKGRLASYPEFADLLREQKAALLAWLNALPCPGWQAVPPTDLPLNPVTPRPTPTDRERVIAYMRRQSGNKPGELAAWLVRRECAYHDGLGGHWNCALHAYAAARDAGCWQLNRSEAELHAFLVATEESERRLDQRNDP